MKTSEAIEKLQGCKSRDEIAEFLKSQYPASLSSRIDLELIVEELYESNDENLIRQLFGLRGETLFVTGSDWIFIRSEWMINGTSLFQMFVEEVKPSAEWCTELLSLMVCRSAFDQSAPATHSLLLLTYGAEPRQTLERLDELARKAQKRITLSTELLALFRVSDKLSKSLSVDERRHFLQNTELHELLLSTSLSDEEQRAMLSSTQKRRSFKL